MQASKPRQASTSRRERIAAAKLSELAVEGWDATTLERLIVKGLTRYYLGIDNGARGALAAAEPALTGTVRDAVIAATVEHACATPSAEVPAWTQAPERFLKRPSVYRCGLIGAARRWPTRRRAGGLAAGTRVPFRWPHRRWETTDGRTVIWATGPSDAHIAGGRW